MLWIVGILVDRYVSDSASPACMVAGLLAWGASEQVDRVAALVGWVRRKRPRSQ